MTDRWKGTQTDGHMEKIILLLHTLTMSGIGSDVASLGEFCLVV